MAAVASSTAELNYINGLWEGSHSTPSSDLVNPATGEVLARVVLAGEEETTRAIEAAAAAYPEWRRTPPQDRIQYMFRFRELLLQHADEIARITTEENGKTLTESRAELQRGIENVEVSCGIPIMMQGYNLEDVARGIDEIMIRQPLGVVAAITPFNFPSMIPLWFMPYALATGNTFILKASERVPLTAKKLFELLHQAGLPKGVANLIVGAKPAVDTLLHHPAVRAISFVGSTPVAKYVYSEGSLHGKRVQCQGGAKNYVVVMPDADMEMTAQIVSDSAFGCAGQRCLAVSVAVTVADSGKTFNDALLTLASKIKTGNGADQGTTMGPVITPESKARILGLVQKGEENGAKVLLDGRAQNGRGNFIAPTVLANVDLDNPLTGTEIFGPVLTVNESNTLDDAIDQLSKSAFGNSAAIFTSNGAAARRFRYEVPSGNIGVNVGVAAPMAYFPFSGWRDSFMGVLHGQGKDAIEFYTDKKVVIERWPKEWSRRF